MKTLKECKDFGEIYEVIGEDRFCGFAKLLLAVLVATPFIFGIINYAMLLDYYHYDAYNFNYTCMTVCNIIYAIMLMWSLMYYLGKVQYMKLNSKQLIGLVKESECWILIWAALLIWTIVPITFSANPLGAIIGKTFLGSGYISHVFMWGVMGCAAMVADRIEREDLLKSFVIVANVLGVIMMSFELDIPFLKGFTAQGGVSVYTNRNHYGYIIAMSCAVMYGMYLKCLHEKEGLKKRLFYILSFAFNMYVLMINDTLGAYLAIVISYFVTLILWRVSGRKLGIKQFVPLLIIAGATAISAMGFITAKDWGSTIGQSLVVLWMDLFKIANKSDGYEEAGSLRMIIWMNTVKMIKARPIVGHGPDVYCDPMLNTLMDTPHNEFLECAFFLGIPGLVLYFSGLVGAFVKKCKQLKELDTITLVAASGVISYLISSFVGVRKFNTVCYFFMLMGLLIGRRCLATHEDKQTIVDKSADTNEIKDEGEM